MSRNPADRDADRLDGLEMRFAEQERRLPAEPDAPPPHY